MKSIFVDCECSLTVMAVCLHFRLALYVYEYLLHVGAQKAAQTFLSEVSTLSVFAFGSGRSAGVAGLTSGKVVPGCPCKPMTLQILRLVINIVFIELIRNYTKSRASPLGRQAFYLAICALFQPQVVYLDYSKFYEENALKRTSVVRLLTRGGVKCFT